MLLRVLEMIARRRRIKGPSSGLWTGLTFAIFLLRLHQRRAARDTISLREELKPGESLLISNTHQPRG
jgi:hypothetical protein